jgi:uncharacterized membrane protein
MKDRLHCVFIPLVAFFAILPLLVHGCSCGHDFDFHLLNWLEANTQLHHFTWPQWAFTPAFNAGEPRFLFYPPLSWLIGAALTQILPVAYTAIAFTFLTLTAAGFALRHLAISHTTPAAATVAAALYIVNPYMLFTAYERTAYAELLAAACIPLLFAAILAQRPKILQIAFPITILWLTNAPAGVMSTYALCALAIFRLAQANPRERFHLARNVAAGTTLGLGLAGFYVVPAAYERRFVQIKMVIISGLSPADNFLFHKTPDADHDMVLHTASVVACLLLAATTIALIAAKHSPSRRTPTTSLLVPFALLAAIVGILLTKVSLPLWNHLPDLAFLQFPWRLLALLTPILALATAVALKPLTSIRNTAIATALLSLLLVTPAWHFFQQECDAPDTPEARAALYHSPHGTEPIDEYTPISADNDHLHPENPPYWLLSSNSSINAPGPVNAPPGPITNHLALQLADSAFLILNRREYPLWRIEVNHHLVSSMQRRDGLIALPLLPGNNTIDLILVHSPDEHAGWFLSSISGLILLGIGLYNSKRKHLA